MLSLMVDIILGCAFYSVLGFICSIVYVSLFNDPIFKHPDDYYFVAGMILAWPGLALVLLGVGIHRGGESIVHGIIRLGGGKTHYTRPLNILDED